MIKKALLQLVPWKNSDPKRKKNLMRAYLWSIAFCLFGCIVALTPRFNPNFYTFVVFAPIFQMSRELFEGAPLLGAEPITIETKDDVKLRAWFFQGNQGAKTVLLCHGKTANMYNNLDFAAYFRSNFGASVLLFDYRGHGYSTGTPTIGGICDDGLAVFDYLTQQRKIAAQDIVVVGESLGSLPACQILKNRKCAGVVVNCGFGSLSRKLKEAVPIFGMFPDWFLAWDDRMDNELAVSGEHSPFLVAHGSVDAMFDVNTQARALYTAASEPKQFLVFDGIGHSREFLLSRRYLDSLRPMFKQSDGFVATSNTDAH